MKRPLGIYYVSAFFTATAVFVVVGWVRTYINVRSDITEPEVARMMAPTFLTISSIVLAECMLLCISAWGTYRARPWAKLLSIILSTVILLLFPLAVLQTTIWRPSFMPPNSWHPGLGFYGGFLLTIGALYFLLFDRTTVAAFKKAA